MSFSHLRLITLSFSLWFALAGLCAGHSSLSTITNHQNIARATPSTWISTGKTKTMLITTAAGTGRCGASGTTRTVCSPTATCRSVSYGYSTCTKSTTATPTISKKKGISYNEGEKAKLFGNNFAWSYNWWSNQNGTLPSGVDFMPMLWSSRPDHTGIWKKNVETAIKNGATHLLGFNEPDFKWQADMTVDEAVKQWRTWMQPYAGRIKLVSPAITNGGAPGGVTWLKDFINKCTGCTIDGVAMHWYDSATNFGYFYNYFNDAAATFAPRKIWLTEFRGSGTAAQQITFIKTVVPWMDKHSGIEKYAIFGAFEGKASEGDMITNSKLNDVGKAYASAK